MREHQFFPTLTDTCVSVRPSLGCRLAHNALHGSQRRAAILLHGEEPGVRTSQRFPDAWRAGHPTESRETGGLTKDRGKDASGERGETFLIDGLRQGRPG